MFDERLPNELNFKIGFLREKCHLVLAGSCVLWEPTKLLAQLFGRGLSTSQQVLSFPNTFSTRTAGEQYQFPSGLAHFVHNAGNRELYL